MKRASQWMIGSAAVFLGVLLLPRRQFEPRAPSMVVRVEAPPAPVPPPVMERPDGVQGHPPESASAASPPQGERPEVAVWRPRWFDPHARAVRFEAFLQRQLASDTLTSDEATALRDVRAAAARDMAALRARYVNDEVGVFEAAFTGWGIVQAARSRAEGVVGADRLDALRADARIGRRD